MTEEKTTANLRDFIKKHYFWIICALPIFIQLIFSLRFAGRQYFSLDEVSQIGFIAKKNSWGRIIDYYLTSEVTNLPLWPLLAALWYRIVPYGEGWMRLLTVIFTTLSIITLINGARAYKGDRGGLIMAALSCISSVIMQKCGLTFRVHAFWLLFTSLTLWLYIERMKEGKSETVKTLVLLSISEIFLAYSHYFGCLTIIYFFLMDVVFFFRNVVRKRAFIPHVAAGGSLLPWFLLMLSKRTMVLSEFWPKTPTFESIPRALRYLVSKDEAVYILFILAMIVSFLKLLDSIFKDYKDFDQVFLRFGLAFMPLIFITLDYIYSAHINPKSGIFVLRYFLSVLPAALLTVTVFLTELLDAVSSKFNAAHFYTYGAALLFILCYFGSGNYYYDVKDEVSAPFDNTYGNVRDYIIEKGGLSDGRSVIAINANRANADGFEEYYLERGGQDGDVRVISNEDPDMEESLRKADRVYIYQVMNGTPDIFTDILSTDYEETAFDEDISLYVFERKR